MLAMIHASGSAGFQRRPAPAASTQLIRAVAASLAIACLSLSLVTMTVLSAKVTMAMLPLI